VSVERPPRHVVGEIRACDEYVGLVLCWTPRFAINASRFHAAIQPAARFLRDTFSTVSKLEDVKQHTVQNAKSIL